MWFWIVKSVFGRVLVLFSLLEIPFVPRSYSDTPKTQTLVRVYVCAYTCVYSRVLIHFMCLFLQIPLGCGSLGVSELLYHSNKLKKYGVQRTDILSLLLLCPCSIANVQSMNLSWIGSHPRAKTMILIIMSTCERVLCL